MKIDREGWPHTAPPWIFGRKQTLKKEDYLPAVNTRYVYYLQGHAVA
jgi:hypothetical protein